MSVGDGGPSADLAGKAKSKSKAPPNSAKLFAVAFVEASASSGSSGLWCVGGYVGMFAIVRDGRGGAVDSAGVGTEKWSSELLCANSSSS